MKTYYEALARVQELVDEKHSNACELGKLDNLYFDAERGSAEEKRLEKEIGYLRWRSQVLEGDTRGALSLLRFIYGEDGHDVYDDIKFYWKESDDS